MKGGIALNVAMIHFRVGETDGVSLEMDKWKEILEMNGHKVYYIAGSKGTSEAFIIKELYYRDDYDELINRECFDKLDYFDEIGLEKAIIEQSKKIEQQFIELFKEYNIEMVIPNNILCLGRSLHIGMALTNAIIKTKIRVIGHHHDFYWERKNFSKPTTPYVKNLLETYYPPKKIENMQHVVINKIAKKDLMERKGLESTVIPNVFDFNQEPWAEDDYNKKYKSDLGILDNQIIFLQATRVTNRKAIELAIDVIAVLNESSFRKKIIGKTLYNGKVFLKNSELVLVVVGLHEGGEGYEDKLIQYAKDKNINMLVRPEFVDHKRHEGENHKVYALWDAYVYCDMITYPSIYEGWGNQFLEGIFARKPQIVFEYPVFESDIKEYGFDYISLGNNYDISSNGLAKVERKTLKRVANEVIEYLTNAKIYNEAVSKNYEIAKKFLSVGILEKLVIKLIEER